MGDVVVGVAEGLVGNWRFVPSFCGDEIFMEDYSSEGIPAYVSLKKNEGSWGVEICCDRAGKWGMSEDVRFFGLDSYRQAYDYFSEFSRGLVLK